MANIAYIALGSNLGHSFTTIVQAIKDLARDPAIRVTAISSMYATRPTGYLDQDNFINAVCEVETTLSPEELLKRMFETENRFLRVRVFKNGPRTLDLDLISYADVVSATPELTLPHEHTHERDFVLVPLNEIAPDYVMPRYNKKVSRLLEELPEHLRTNIIKIL
ncbi:MAG: 2-amino-4-hydroxy-6-hydroxymethyldihydropteridine diphosphokinase [Succinivibrio sp.]|nr:2-amino-4-hydroxy-6-hydroxymethyldihydropteridine diphosphokinase [Succinivibrio sp.]